MRPKRSVGLDTSLFGGLYLGYPLGFVEPMATEAVSLAWVVVPLAEGAEQLLRRQVEIFVASIFGGALSLSSRRSALTNAALRMRRKETRYRRQS